MGLASDCLCLHRILQEQEDEGGPRGEDRKDPSRAAQGGQATCVNQALPTHGRGAARAGGSAAVQWQWRGWEWELEPDGLAYATAAAMGG